MAAVPAAETLDGHKDRFDLGVFVGDLALDEEVTSVRCFIVVSDDESLEGLQQELDNCKNDQEVANILANGIKLREYTKGVENNIRQIELDSIQDYIKESENLVSLHDQIHDCDNILSQMETVLTGFQTEIGSISSEIKVLQEKSMDMGLKLKNRKAIQTAAFGAIQCQCQFLSPNVYIQMQPNRLMKIFYSTTMQVNDEYMKTLETLSKKIKFIDADPMVKSSKALKDVQPEVERLRQKAVSKVLSAHFRAYIQALEKLQMDIATSTDLLGVETRSTGFIFSIGKEPLKTRPSVFALGEQINILKEIDQPALIPHIAEAKSHKYSYEVLFRSLQKLLIDTATSEYLFTDDFFGEESIFHDIFAGPIQVVDEHFNAVLLNCYDAIGIMLMIRIIYQHQLIMFKRRIPCLDFYLDKVEILGLILNGNLFCYSNFPEAGTEGGKAQQHFEEVLKSNIAIYVEELLLEQFSGLIKFVKSRPDLEGDARRLTECVKRINGGSALNKDLVSISSILFEIKKYSRTF
ncbi:unnamed protein product [Miscanthus lutarioriparius]|uniref:Vps52 C-terminal domain-containing protein n=1 Tax=Miscanthus lutarioriparius TaxID=422564 RepID=A0A811MUN2_9POAL|nr:unnamed protein product [Miscanthus lutarioriparius]